MEAARAPRPAAPSAEPAAVDVSVLVPVLNEQEHIRAAAEAMLAQRGAGSVEFIFIDGGSEDDTRALLEQLRGADDRVRILDNPRRTTPVGLNIGLRASRGAVIARMDAHTHYPEDYLAVGLERLRRGGVAHVSGPQLPYGVGRWSRRVALALTSRLGTGEADFRHLSQDEIEVDSGFTGLWWRSTLDAHGGWDEDWPNDQDTELAARIRESGGRILCLPQMAARYIPRDSLWKLARQYWRYGLYRAKTSGRHPESMRRSHVLAPGLVVVLALSCLTRGRASWPFRAGVAAYVLAVLGVSASEAKPGRRADAASLPLVFATMHVAWGLGFIAGSARFGPPLEAVRLLLGRSDPA
jgi:glycosyltransferase involved in cell wall biosynthesis